MLRIRATSSALEVLAAHRDRPLHGHERRMSAGGLEAADPRLLAEHRPAADARPGEPGLARRDAEAGRGTGARNARGRRPTPSRLDLAPGLTGAPVATVTRNGAALGTLTFYEMPGDLAPFQTMAIGSLSGLAAPFTGTLSMSLDSTDIALFAADLREDPGGGQQFKPGAVVDVLFLFRYAAV
jgi:hypothetical protein